MTSTSIQMLPVLNLVINKGNKFYFSFIIFMNLCPMHLAYTNSDLNLNKSKDSDKNKLKICCRFIILGIKHLTTMTFDFLHTSAFMIKLPNFNLCVLQV